MAVEERKEVKERLERAYKELKAERERLERSYEELKTSKDELVRSEKLAFTGRIAASIAHEIRNPLTNMRMSVEELSKVIKPEDPRARYVEIINKNSERVNFLITELLNCARPPRLEIKPCNIHRILKDVLESVKAKLKAKRIKIEKKYTSGSPIINVDREQIERVFLNIINNAIESMRLGGRLVITTEPTEDHCIVKVKDTGRGIPEKDIINIFDPFFSTKDDGVGLGLTLSYGIVVSHGGTIEVESKVRRGSLFTISLPIRQR